MNLPFCDVTENIALSACFNACQSFDQIKPEYFHDLARKTAYEAIQAGVFAPMAGSGISQQVYFEALEAGSTSILREDVWKKLKDLYHRREAIKKFHSDLGRLQDPSKDISDLNLYNEAESWLFDREAIAERSVKDKNSIKPVYTGIDIFDKRAVSLGPGHVWVIGGRSGTMKTGLALQLMDGLCRSRDEHGLFFSMEMPPIDLARRMHSIAYYRQFGSMWQSDEWGLRSDCENDFRRNYDLQMALDVFSPRIDYCTKAKVSIQEIKQMVNKAKKTKNIKTIVIDYLQIMKGPYDDEYKDIAYNMPEFKSVAKECDVLVIPLSQLNRKAGDGTEEPNIHDLKGSGAIEENADFVTLQWRDKNDFGFDNRFVNVKNAKTRNGAIPCKYKIATDGTYFRDPYAQELEMWK